VQHLQAQYRYVQLYLIMKQIIVIVLILALLLSCGRVDPKKIGEYTLTKNEANLNPYTGHDSLVFEDSLNHKIVFIGVDRITDTNCFFNDTFFRGYPTKYYTEVKDLTYFKTNIMCDSTMPKKPYIIVGVKAKVNFNNPNINPSFIKYLQINLPEYSHDYNCKSYFRLDVINEKLCVKDTIDKHFDKVTIGGKSYYDVFKLHSSNVDIDRFDSNYIYPKTMFYSKTSGIISFKMSNGQNFIKRNEE